ncbi:MAG: right-handed parallel beta-helix repeat-containing protein [Candidatus Saccharimonadales bacterium]
MKRKKKLSVYINKFKNKSTPMFVILIVAVLGLLTVLISRAATPNVAVELENSNLTGCAEKVTDSGASGSSTNNAIRFGTGSSCGSSSSGVYGAQLPINYNLSSLTGSIKYVAPNGNDGGSGNVDSPYLTLSKAISAVSTGGTIVMRGGIYRGNVNVGVTKTVKIVAYPGEIPELRGSVTVPSSSASNSGWNTEGNYKWRSYNPRPVTGGSGFDFPNSNMGLAGDYSARYPDQAWIGDSSLDQVTNKSALTDGKFWADSSNKRLYLTASDASKPNIEISRSAPSSSDRDRAIQIKSPNVRMEGIKVARYSNTADDYGVVIVDSGSHGTVLKNVMITDSALLTLTVNIADSVVVENSTFTRSNWMGVSAVQTDSLTLKAVKITDMNYLQEFTVDPQTGGMKASKTRKTKVIDSYIANNYSPGLWYDDSNTDAVIASSYILDNEGNGVFWEIADGLLLANNFIRQKSKKAAFADAGSSGVKMINNTIIGGTNPVAIYTDGRSAPKCASSLYPYSACVGDVWSSNRLSELNPNPPPELLARQDGGSATRFGRRPSLDWMPRIDMMINNVMAYPNTTETYICPKVPLCFMLSHGSGAKAPIETILHKANKPWSGIPETVMNGNVYATNESGKTLIYIREGGVKYTDLGAFRNTMAASPVSINGIEANGLQGAEYVNTNGSPTQKLIDRYSNAVPVPSDSGINSYIPAGTRRYGTTLDTTKY